MRVLFDTVTFLWAADSPERLSRAGRSLLANDSVLIELSSVSIAEIAIKQSIGKLDFGRDECASALADLRLRALPYTDDHARRLFGLPLHHTDPFDRLIIAQCLVEEIPIVTPDSKFARYDGLEILW